MGTASYDQPCRGGQLMGSVLQLKNVGSHSVWLGHRSLECARHTRHRHISLAANTEGLQCQGFGHLLQASRPWRCQTLQRFANRQLAT